MAPSQSRPQPGSPPGPGVPTRVATTTEQATPTRVEPVGRSRDGAGRTRDRREHTPAAEPATGRAPRPPGSSDDPDEPVGRTPLLARLNAHGFRLIQLADLVLVTGLLVAPMVLSFGWDWPDYPMWQYLVSFSIIIATFLASFYFGGLYEREPRLGRPPVLPWAFRQSLAAGALVALANLVVTGALEMVGTDTARALPIPTTRLIVLIVASPLAVAFVRWAAAQHRTRREGPPRVMLLGSEHEIEVARRHLERAEASVVATSTTVTDLAHLVDVSDTTNLVLLSADWAASLYPDMVDRLERRNVSVLQRVTAAETLYGLQRVRQVGGLPFVLLRPHVMPSSRAHLKRLTDVVLLAVGAILWVPLLALIAGYQLVVAGRPLLFWQVRIGAEGEPFRMVKFRTMTVDAEEDGSPRLATRDDPRIIPACRWVRATRMDELPQLFNILRGEMSLVGPRPERPELTVEFSDAIRGYARRHEVPPGLTGLAQIHGHYHTDPEYKLGYDLQYVANWSPMLDLEILARTIWVVLARRV